MTQLGGLGGASAADGHSGDLALFFGQAEPLGQQQQHFPPGLRAPELAGGAF